MNLKGNTDDKNLFDAVGYFRNLCTKNKLARTNMFCPCTCSGIDSLEEVLDAFRRESAFIAVDDTNDGVTERRSGGFFKKRTFTIFVMIRYKLGNMSDRQEKLSLCREIFRQFHTRMIQDKDEMGNDLIYLGTDNIYSRELGEYFISGCTGLYFMVDVAEPIDLVYNNTEWDE